MNGQWKSVRELCGKDILNVMTMVTAAASGAFLEDTVFNIWMMVENQVDVYSALVTPTATTTSTASSKCLNRMRNGTSIIANARRASIRSVEVFTIAIHASLDFATRKGVPGNTGMIGRGSALAIGGNWD